MKTMTCKQMGGPCDAVFSGDAVAQGDETHQSALESMQARWKHPISGMGWYRKTKKDFAALPEG